MTKQTKFFLNLVVAGVIFLIGYHLAIREREEIRPPLILGVGLYQLGDIIVDTMGGEIRFEAEVRERDGWVQHLIHLQGYEWLKEESAIIAEVRLADLQKTIALLDWELWDELWLRNTTEGRRQRAGVRGQGAGNRGQGSGVRGQRVPILSALDGAARQARNRKLLLSVKWGEEEIAAQELVLAEDKLGIGDFIFLGSPYFDPMVLEAHVGRDCRLCPIFPLKEKVLREFFIREVGPSGYELNSAIFPPERTKVIIIIRIAD